jgi:hypothetical protein
MDHTLDYWYKDLVDLLTGEMPREHINQPGFSYMSVGFVIGTNHGQGPFCAGVNFTFHNANGSSIEAMAIYGLGGIACTKDTATSFWHYHSPLQGSPSKNKNTKQAHLLLNNIVAHIK